MRVKAKIKLGMKSLNKQYRMSLFSIFGLCVVLSLAACAPKNENLKAKYSGTVNTQAVNSNPMNETEFSKFMFYSLEKVPFSLNLIKIVLNENYALKSGFKLVPENNKSQKLVLKSNDLKSKSSNAQSETFEVLNFSYSVEKLNFNDDSTLKELVLQSENKKKLQHKGFVKQGKNLTDFAIEVSFERYELTQVDVNHYKLLMTRNEVSNSKADKKTAMLTQGQFVLEWDGSIESLDKTLKIVSLSMTSERSLNKTGVFNFEMNSASVFDVNLDESCVSVNAHLILDKPKVDLLPVSVENNNSGKKDSNSNGKSGGKGNSEKAPPAPFVIEVKDSSYERKDSEKVQVLSKANSCENRPVLDLTRFVR